MLEKGRVGIVEGESKRLLCGDGFDRLELPSVTLLWICERRMMDDDTSTLDPVAAA